jgi:dihydroorotase
MFDLLLRRARLVDDTLTDIAIQDGKIAALGEISAPAAKPLSCTATLRQRRLD